MENNEVCMAYNTFYGFFWGGFVSFKRVQRRAAGDCGRSRRSARAQVPCKQLPGSLEFSHGRSHLLLGFFFFFFLRICAILIPDGALIERLANDTYRELIKSCRTKKIGPMTA